MYSVIGSVVSVVFTHGCDLITALRFYLMGVFMFIRPYRDRGYRYIRRCCHVRGFYHIPWVVDPFRGL